MARTKETKMFPEQQEKMTQEVMASLQPSTYGKDYAQKHSSFFEEVENSDLLQSLPVDGIVIVTSPQELVQMIVKKAYNMAEMMHVPDRKSVV